MKTLNIFKIFFILSTSILSSCQQDPEPGGTATQKFAGEWYVTIQTKNDVGQLEGFENGYVKIITSNVASNSPDTILITDQTGDAPANRPVDEGNFWTFKIKAAVDRVNNTISSPNAKSIAMYDGEPYPIGVKLTNGKLFPDLGKSTSGVKTDSIYFEISFEDDADGDGNGYQTNYVISGHRRTGFLEDEH